ncbi:MULTISPECIES: alanine/glycine:cation symporter family protein [Spirulina sp. CCY15215]|uniref:alanine/glycine:cation symporter family protein n=1 Tax=Spirulina sp. CCY15215 TaxID=2767591 RepID=UPI00194F0368|nr:alanine/glycine:cation symporter family protein [Spirulina major]
MLQLDLSFLFLQADRGFKIIIDGLYDLLFLSIGGCPLIVIWLLLGGIIVSFRLNLLNLRGFTHAVEIARGKYDNPGDRGEVSSLQALATALSATVGVGNIAGVAIAIGLGGVGAVFWMMFTALLAANLKFLECTLAQKYRLTSPDGHFSGGPTQYLSRGLAKQGREKLGKFCAIAFSLFCIFASWGACGMFQTNQSYGAFSHVMPFLPPGIYGTILVVCVGVVILGGIERIGRVAEWLVPIMCGIYLSGAFCVLVLEYDRLPEAIVAITSEAFTLKAGLGGLMGTIVQGIQRGSFSNEMGLGSAAIAHAVSKQSVPIREGFLASLEPLIIAMISLLTGLVIVVTGVYKNSELVSTQGGKLAVIAFENTIPWFPYLLAAAMFLFALSTAISWGYYGESCWVYLFGQGSTAIYKVILLGFIFLGAIVNSESVVKFGDVTMLAMSIPNILGLYFLCGEVKEEAKIYMKNLASSAETILN